MAMHSGNSLRVYHAKFFYRFRIKALGYVGNMQSSNAAVGKLGPLWLMHHIHINILAQLPETDYEYAIFNTI